MCTVLLLTPASSSHHMPGSSTHANQHMVLQVPTTLSDLPPALPAQVLSHVPQQQRLTQCALVCCTWASAATLGTVHVEGRLEEENLPAFECWLQQRAGQLRTLKLLSPARSANLRLSPGQFQRLQRLELERLSCSFQASSSETLTALSSS